MIRATSFKTTILAEDEQDFSNYLLARGFKGFTLAPNRTGTYLTLSFEDPKEIMQYRLKAVEERFKAARSNTYFYDLEENWDEAEEFFNGESD